jgi:signal transduction histidine kinase
MAKREETQSPSPCLVAEDGIIPSASIADIVDVITSDAPLETCLELILKQACEFTGAQYGAVLLLNEAERTLGVEALHGYTSDEIGGFGSIVLNVDEEEGICSSVVLQKKAIVADDVCAFPNYIEILPDVRSELAAPIWGQGEVIGVVNLESTGIGVFSKERREPDLLEVLGQLIGAAVRLRASVSAELEAVLRDLISDVDVTEGRLARSVVEWVSKDLHVGECSLFLLKPRSEKLICVASLIQGGTGSDLIGDEYEFGEGLTGWVAANGKPLLINNLQDPDEYQKYRPVPQWANKPSHKLKSVTWRKYLGVPIKADGKTVGVLRVSDLYSSHEHAVRNYVYSDQRFLEMIADRFADALTYVKEKVKLKEIYTISADINSQVDKELVLTRILEASVRMTAATEGSIFLVEGDLLIPYVTMGDREQEVPALTMGGVGIPAWVAENGKEYLCNDVSGIPNEGQSPAYSQLRGKIVSELAVPLIREKEVVGVIDVASVRRGSFNDDDVWSLSLLAEQVVTTVDRSRTIADLEEKTANLLRLSDRLHEATLAATASALTVGNIHSVRNSLSRATEALETLAKMPYVRQNRQVLELVEAACKQAQEMSKIFARSLQFYESMSPEFESVDVNSLVREVGEVVYPKISSRRISFSVIPAEKLPQIRGDKLLLRVVLINLLLNAIDASPRMIRIRTGVDDRIVAGNWTQFVRISVTDDGHGIPVELRERIFDPFFTTKERGSGLGLFVSKDVTQKHSGRILVESTVGRGTTFHIELPVSELPAQQ